MHFKLHFEIYTHTMSKVIKKSLTIDKFKYYKTHLSIINPIIDINLTDKEIEVLACFMMLSGDLENDPFSTTGRKIVKEKLNLSFGGLSNYLNQLKEKGCIISRENKLQIPEILIPNKNEQIYSFKLSYE